MTHVGLKFLFLIGLAAASVDVEKDKHDEQLHISQFKSKYFDFGDPRLCMVVGRDNKLPVQRFEVLPGIGWDNLQNIPKGQLVQFNYSKCLTTDDGRFLVPDHVFTIPLKESFVDTFAELLDSWHNTSSTTSNSINVNAGLSFKSMSVSGSFSWEHTQIKKKQIEDKAVTVRVQLRYHRYKSQLQPDAELHPAFKRRLLNIAALKELNQTEMARYEAQLIVRDFGTHVQTSIIAGAGLVKTDFIKRDYAAEQSEDKTKILVSASASYSSFFKMNGSYGHSTDNKDYQSYLKSMSHSYVTSYGGPILKAFNMSTNDWTKGVDIELVPMDVYGDPLSFLVTQQTLPELPTELVYDVEKILRQAIVQYYEMNTISGCTNMGSPNFRVSANFDDGSCESEATNMTFGGVYQTCSVTGQYMNNNPCKGMSQVNPKTRSLSCPPSYTAVKFFAGTKIGVPEHRKECHDCGFLYLFTCCETENFLAMAKYTAFWCAALDHVEPDSGYLFGGIFSSTQDNAITGNKACPPNFYSRVFLDQHICISDDFELGTPYSVPFGGFMSCSVGNPLSMPGVHPVGLKLQATPLKLNSLNSFMASNWEPVSWPMHCPSGYSQHLASIVDGCEIRYCLKSGSLSGPNLPKIKLPPFQDKPSFIGHQNTRFMFNPQTQEWITDRASFDKLSKASKLTSSNNNENSDSSSLGPGAAAAIGVGVTMFCGIIALLAFSMFQRRRRRGGRQTGNVRQLTEENAIPIQPGVNYGSSNSCTVDLPVDG